MEPWLDATIFGITLFFMLVGLLGTFLPFFPGLMVIWGSALGYGIVVGFNTIGIIVMVLITLLMLFGSLADNILLGAGAHKGGAAWWVILIGMGIGFVATIIFPPFGGVVATPLSIFLIEYLRVKDVNKAVVSVKGAAVGWGVSYIARIVSAFVMIVIWFAWVFIR